MAELGNSLMQGRDIQEIKCTKRIVKHVCNQYDNSPPHMGIEGGIKNFNTFGHISVTVLGIIETFKIINLLKIIKNMFHRFNSFYGGGGDFYLPLSQKSFQVEYEIPKNKSTKN